MKLRSAFFAVILVSACFAIGCDKNDDDDNDDISQNAQNISSSSWKISTVTVMGVDFTSQIPACNLDNVFTFEATGAGTVAEGASVCDPSNSGNFTWTFMNNESQLSTTTNLIPGGASVFQVNSISSTTMVLSQETTLTPAPVPVTVTVTFVH